MANLGREDEQRGSRKKGGKLISHLTQIEYKHTKSDFGFIYHQSEGLGREGKGREGREMGD